ncbi:MAG: hypothetical protein Alpg2KO_02780 [Alphaproteobacteria bacterium]
MPIPAFQAFNPQPAVSDEEWEDLQRFIGSDAVNFAGKWNNELGRRRLGWNMLAFLFGEFWLLYRRMFISSLIFLLVTSFGASVLLGAGASPIGVLIYIFGLRIALAMEADGYYFAHSLLQVRMIREAPLSPEQKEMVMNGLGGTSMIAVGGMAMIVLVMLVEIGRSFGG